MKSDKKGLSDIIVTVLMILLAISAVVIIWFVLQPFIKNNLQTATEFDIDCSVIKSITIDSALAYNNSGPIAVNVTVSRTAEGENEDLSGLQFYLDGNKRSVALIEPVISGGSASLNPVPNKYVVTAGKTYLYRFSPGGAIADIKGKKVGVAAIISNTKTCSVMSEVTI